MTGRIIRICLLLFIAAALHAAFPAQCCADDWKMIDLTIEEQNFLKEHPVLRLGVGVAFPPFQYVEKERGGYVFKGMVSDYVDLLSRRLGVEMQPVFGIDFKTALRMGREGKIDLFPCISDTPERRQFLTFTEPYLSYPLVIVSRDDAPFIGGITDLQGKKVAIVRALANWSKIRNDYPDLKAEFVFEQTVPDILTAVSMGRADACMANLAVVSYLIKKHGLSNLRVAAPTPWDKNTLAMGVPNDRAVLAGILQKALDSITWQEKDEISDRWISLKMENIVDTSKVWTTVLGVSAAALLIILAITAWNRRLRKEIRERRRAEATLRSSEEKYRNLIESTDTAFVIMDSDGKVLDANRKYLELTGRAEFSDIIGSRVETWVPEGQREKHGRAVRECTGSGFMRDVQMDFVMPDGTVKPVELNGACHSAFETTEIHVLCRDISNRKRAEEMLIHSEKMMSVGGIAAGIAHEVNNPLTAVLGNTQNLTRRIQPGLPANERVAAELGISVETVREYLRRRGIGEMLDAVREGAVRAAKVISSLLDFSRGNITGFSVCDLKKIIEEAVDLAGADYDLSRKYDFKNMALTVEYDPDMPLIRCNPAEIRQVLLNLLRNASQAAPGRRNKEEKPAIAISTKVDGDFALIKVRDNGPGMDADTRRRIFEPFFTTAAPNEGAGLGLSVAYFIVVRNHGGTIDVKTGPGRGAAFAVRLPVEGPAYGAAPPDGTHLMPDIFDR